MSESVRSSVREQARPSLWDRLCRFNLSHRRISREALVRFCAQTASKERTLVVHSVDVDHRRYFPNSFVISSRTRQPADLHADRYYHVLQQVPDASYPVILCTGLLEHIPDPPRVVGEFHRILQPGGRLVLSASAVFPFHGGPDNFFHYTPHGFRHLFAEWSRIERLEGSSRPFETIGILLQRINMQCDVFPPARVAIELSARIAPLLDVFVLRQYDSRTVMDKAHATDSIMPAMLHAVVIR